MTGPDNTIDYLDQGSFMGLRALGRGPVIQFTWIYDRPVDLDGLRRLQRNLGEGGLLGRRIERSPLPFGRHRWVSSPGPVNLDVAAQVRSRADAGDWTDDRVHLPVDPEQGPAWHLGAQPLEGGGSVVSLVVSHTIGDALAISEAVADAIDGAPRDLGYPLPGSRTRGEAVRQDMRQTIRSVPSWFAAVAGLARIAREQKSDLATSARTTSAPVTTGTDAPVRLPTVTLYVETETWNRRAESLGGTSNVLFAAFGARLGQVIGRVADDGRAMLSFPVSIRSDGDTRGNALTTITVMTDPAPVDTDLSELRSGIKQELAGVDEWTTAMMTPLPLTPLVPKFAARRLEKMVLKVGKPIGCSNIGTIAGAVNRPDGTDADRMSIRMIEPGLTSADLERLGGHLFLVAAQTARFTSVTVTGWTLGAANDKDSLGKSVQQTLDELGLTGTVE
ncbi:MAG: hypothetical protein WCE30_18380 [Mycobacterium sp.]